MLVFDNVYKAVLKKKLIGITVFLRHPIFYRLNAAHNAYAVNDVPSLRSARPNIPDKAVLSIRCDENADSWH